MNTLPFRAVITDLDGTLLNQDHRVSRENSEILHQLRALGVDIIFATGRNYPDVKHIMNSIGIDDAFLITSNGARVNHLQGDIVAYNYIDEAISQILVNFPVDTSKVVVNSYQGDEWFIDQDIPLLKAFHADSGYEYQVVDFRNHHYTQTEKVFFISQDVQEIVKIQHQLTACFGNNVQVTRSLPYVVEVMQSGVNKAQGLHSVLANKDYGFDACVAFGDGFNDRELLTAVKKGYLMANSEPKLKQALEDIEVIGFNYEHALCYKLREIFNL